ncbi:hypothetical protein Bealeia2_02073 (plasmid) [Candidatus Bealeia paramacronuclearis]|nr:hypothetical protein [Candidatus Bealeia paramacronuclearis]
MVFDNDVISTQLAFENILYRLLLKFMPQSLWRMITMRYLAPRLMRNKIPKR